MPSLSLFKSRPKTDRRLQWKALKAKHAKTLETKKIKVEIGLGKALDGYHKAVENVTKLDAAALTPEAFAPVVASGAEVKKAVATLQLRIKGIAELTEYLADLKKDVAWWEKAATDFKQQPDKFERASKDVKEAADRVLDAVVEIKKMDALLAGAVKKTSTYTPPADVVAWQKLSQGLQAPLEKLAVLNKSRDGNAKLLTTLLRQLQEPMEDIRTKALHMSGIAGDNLPPVADWKAVEVLTRAVMDTSRTAARAIHDTY
jgi:hypothetical protein